MNIVNLQKRGIQEKINTLPNFKKYLFTTEVNLLQYIKI